MTTWENIKDEVERTKSGFSHAAKGTEERLIRGKEFIKALNVAIEAIERFWTGTALILNADALRRDGELRTALREYQEWARQQKREVRKEVGPQLIDSWLADESGYDEAAWPAVQSALDGNRTP
ncbi:MAG: hypothetical protein DMF60_14960 [Acidobacteria bacterium]|nr:MAG: hypothetical protein DMF60_14960 [Acidobacteriota bacterium]